MWGTVLSGVLGQATKPPQQIKLENDEQNANLAMYAFAAVVLIVIGCVFIKIIKK